MWGLAFKLNTDDIREVSTLAIIDALIKLGATLTAYDSKATHNVKAHIGDKINYAENQYGALAGAAALIIAIERS
jgi:UDPglucose 6-dehydrogenase